MSHVAHPPFCRFSSTGNDRPEDIHLSKLGITMSLDIVAGLLERQSRGLCPLRKSPREPRRTVLLANHLCSIVRVDINPLDTWGSTSPLIKPTKLITCGDVPVEKADKVLLRV